MSVLRIEAVNAFFAGRCICAGFAVFDFAVANVSVVGVALSVFQIISVIAEFALFFVCANRAVLDITVAGACDFDAFAVSQLKAAFAGLAFGFGSANLAVVDNFKAGILILENALSAIQYISVSADFAFFYGTAGRAVFGASRAMVRPFG